MSKCKNAEQVIFSRVQGSNSWGFSESWRVECFTKQICTHGAISFARVAVSNNARSCREIAFLHYQLTNDAFCENEKFLKDDVEYAMLMEMRRRWPSLDDKRWPSLDVEVVVDSVDEDIDIRFSKLETVPCFETDNEWFGWDPGAWWRVECFVNQSTIPVGLGYLKDVDGEASYLESLLVHPELRKQGIATEMLERIGEKWPKFGFTASTEGYWEFKPDDYDWKTVWQRHVESGMFKKGEEGLIFDFVPREERVPLAPTNDVGDTCATTPG